MNAQQKYMELVKTRAKSRRNESGEDRRVARLTIKCSTEEKAVFDKFHQSLPHNIAWADALNYLIELNEENPLSEMFHVKH